MKREIPQEPTSRQRIASCSDRRWCGYWHTPTDMCSSAYRSIHATNSDRVDAKLPTCLKLQWVLHCITT